MKIVFKNDVHVRMATHEIMGMRSCWACHPVRQCSKFIDIFTRKDQHFTVSPGETEDSLLVLV